MEANRNLFRAISLGLVIVLFAALAACSGGEAAETTMTPAPAAPTASVEALAATEGVAPTEVPAPTKESIGMANPASVNCTEQGGTLTIATRPDGGEYGVCTVVDNKQCEEWALMRGECPAGGVDVAGYVTAAAHFCAISGGSYEVAAGSNTENEQGNCTFADGSMCDAAAYYNGECAPGDNPAGDATGMANPASVNCTEQGGALSIQTRGDDGEYGVCLFEDNMQCEEWALLRGECPVGGIKVTGYVTPAAVYCAITGGFYTVTADSNTENEQGTCTLANGAQCDASAYYNGECTPAGTPATILPLAPEECDSQAQLFAASLSLTEVTRLVAPLMDPTHKTAGAGCQANTKGNGTQFASPTAPVDAVGAALATAGWTLDTMMAADGPTGTLRGYHLNDKVCTISAEWQPDASANCPADQPITACQVTLEQQLYTVALTCGVESAPVSQTIQPLPMEVCDGQAQAMAAALGVVDVTQSEDPLADPTNGTSGSGCVATVGGNGAQFASPDVPIRALGDMLVAQGWTYDPMLDAGGPTGMGRGFHKDDQVCLVNANWWPDASANCAADQPISACQVTPEQQLYTITLNCGVESTGN